MFNPLLPFSAFPFVGAAHFTAKPLAENACWTRVWAFSTDPFTTMSAYAFIVPPRRGPPPPAADRPSRPAVPSPPPRPESRAGADPPRTPIPCLGACSQARKCFRRPGPGKPHSIHLNKDRSHSVPGQNEEDSNRPGPLGRGGSVGETVA